MDAALEFLAPYGPDLQNGMTSHAPMVAEALCALGRPDAVQPWLERYRSGLAARQRPRAEIPPRAWRSALGATDRTADWTAFFVRELGGQPWREILACWAARLAPGFSASALHGVIRVGHAARSLATMETPARVDELAEGLGYWAANYQTLPSSGAVPTPGHAAGAGAVGRAQDAIDRVAIMPEEKRRFRGTIVSALEALDGYPAFAPVADFVDVAASPEVVMSDLTETFARVYLANARDVLGTIVFVHGVTGAAALRAIVPWLAPAAVPDTIRFAWQAGAALYAAFGSQPPLAGAIDPPREDGATLVDLAIANGDEHAIKFTATCLGEYELNPAPVYLAAARHAIGMLGG
jgi:hypothetical protein